MLVSNTRFVLLGVFCSIATLNLSPHWGVGAAAVQTQPRSFDWHDYYCHDVTSDQPPAQYVLSLPLKSKIQRFKVRTHEWLRSDFLAMFSDLLFAGLKRDGIKCRTRKYGDYSNPAEIARRAVVIPDNHGREYVVSHSRRPMQRRRRFKFRRPNGIEKTELSKRAQDAMVGNVALMSPVYGSTSGRQLATLYAAPNGPGAWNLYASETNRTQFELVNAPVGMESDPDFTPVTLEMGAPGETRTCATYNSNPQKDGSEAESMIMEPCANRAAPEEGNKSQIFMYNSTSGTLSPTWNSSEDITDAAAPLDRNSTILSNATATSSAVQAAATLPADREDVPQNQTKNSTVTLVFTPLKAIIVEDVGTQQNSTTTGKTLIMTKTVTVFNVASTSVGLSSSTSNMASQATSTSSALDVQLVGTALPFSDGTGSATVGSGSVSTSSSTATRSIDAAAIASRIAMSTYYSSASTAGSSTMISPSAAGASPSSIQVAQRRANGKLAASDWKVTSVSTEPYTWIFRTEADER